ncbi:hypothetical protein FQ154_09465 [Paeniglutamicibacter gangotriensis]|uniref:Uncharacterized protein n=1 Tax=Paeniglutamicibacter gangotriensis TaxID=254787 RepID=A0A5B0EH26_9MICC|nr:hypothetical protein [Paeniglutamicibacter gangotriensis]KAA0977121.1 hypothetical protein FQ154_09465 [Paeniglutamicibacter gangotriensis]
MSAKPAADGTEQKRLNFDVPEDLAREFKAYAALQGKTQRELVLGFMHRCVRRTPPVADHPRDSPATHRDK